MPKIEPPSAAADALVKIAQGDMSAENIKTAMTYPQGAPEPELIGRVPPALKRNGPAAKDPRGEYERGLLHLDALTAERDRLEHELRDARLEIAKLKQHIDQVEETRGTIESRINQCVLQRDDAVREAGELRGALNSVAAICVRYHNAQQQD